MTTFTQDNKSTLRFSTMRSKAALLPKKEMIRSSYRGEGVSSARTAKFGRNSPKKPSLLSKRSVSLPTDLQNTTVKTRKLFWFIRAGHRHQRRRQRCDNDFPQQENAIEISGFDGEQQQQIQNGFMSPNRPLSHDIPEKAALEWISTSSTHSLSDSTTSEGTEYCLDDDDDDEGTLLGLEFVDSLRE